MDRFDDKELKAVEEVLLTGELSRFFANFRGGKYVQLFEQEFASYIGSKHAISVSNGTVSLEIALLAMGIKHGHEIITTPLSFVSTGTAILRVGAKPVFVDVEHDTLNIDPDLIEQAITKRTRIILPVSLNGFPVKMSAINEIAKKHALLVLEDAAQALGASIGGRKIGTIGHVGSFSFQESKTITTAGEGGMIVTDDDAIADRVMHIRNHGNVYGTMSDVVCTNARLTEMQAAFGLIQLHKLDFFNKIHKQNAEYFLKHLKPPFYSVWKNLKAWHTRRYRLSHYLIPVVAPDINREHFLRFCQETGLSKGVPGQNIGYWRRLITDVPIFKRYDNGPFPNAEWARDNVYLFDIHRWNKNKRDMQKALHRLNSYKDAEINKE